MEGFLRSGTCSTGVRFVSEKEWGFLLACGPDLDRTGVRGNAGPAFFIHGHKSYIVQGPLPLMFKLPFR